MKLLAPTLIVAIAASAAWPASYRGNSRYGAAHLSAAPIRASGRLSSPRAFAARPLRGSSFGRTAFVQNRRSGGGFGRGFSRALTATPVNPGQTSAGNGAQTTGGNSAGGAFVGTTNNTLAVSPAAA
jgi:hypothetical protein